mmetsp:Transcript_27838/g.45223  ORF Transcript_27838/g.45223 Transcript_27838/m.45223 type:complete len:370 (+) Transcript_27838:92-1201(+)|eukprot:CAMPEP_0184646796 /NCGR_PEP_ID=MMETSP0308-20130426/3586_1 /TAXON_ID=38269 /ORGANISM="Gloeochaete witrockiana, Strain SAG 46.84" /LENGTH=369 /DNA_ID=CAMNT_0027077173 /DNA_START=44 /DNA_END=1153 /DNA_ORIENTATION=+
MSENGHPVKRPRNEATELLHEETAKKQKGDKEMFMDAYVVLRDDMVNGMADYEMPPDAVKYIHRMIEYNVPKGKLNRGLAVISSLRSLMQGESISDSLVFKANAAGWCIEWLQAMFLVADDVMDASITRRGQPCWYKLPEVGMNAVNDSLILESQLYGVIRKHFQGDKYYMDLLHLFQDVSYKTQLGQLLDLTSQEKDKVDLSKFTLETWERIVKYKTAFYSFYLPVAAAMMIAGITDKAAYDVASEILLDMGEYFQAQDDFLDCYGDPEYIGKIGTDIEDNKCGWLIVQALKSASQEQRSILESSYAKKDPAMVAKVKKVYKELDLEGVFAKYETESHKRISDAISKVKVMPQAPFLDLLKKIYKRSK